MHADSLFTTLHMKKSIRAGTCYYKPSCSLYLIGQTIIESCAITISQSTVVLCDGRGRDGRGGRGRDGQGLGPLYLYV